MTNVAILIGNSAYKSQAPLPCCANDIEAVRNLLEATGHYDLITPLLDTGADELKNALRKAIDEQENLCDLLIYYTGHGYQHEAEFYYCASNFDPKRPNETGLSNSELHELIRPGNPALLVKIVDACHSGAPLIKRGLQYPTVEKGTFKNVIQISSCLDNQVSLTGDPLSEFTASFCKAALSKSDGIIYYTDLISAIRDEYIDNESQTPHFVSQSAGREIFAEDASRLAAFRVEFDKSWNDKNNRENNDEDEDQTVTSQNSPDERNRSPSRLEILEAAEQKLIRPENIATITDGVFDGIISELNTDEYSDIFDLEIVEHADFRESTTRGFIIKQLHKESRPDNFVTADIIRTRKKKSRWNFGVTALAALYDDDDFDESWDLRLNCSIPRAQVRISFIPKFMLLQKLTLVVTCAPSLERCYVFAILTGHKRVDFDSFDPEGDELFKSWYKQGWTHEVEWLVDGVCAKVEEVVNSQIGRATGKT